MADKTRVLAISKSDMLDDELMAEIEPTLPEGIPHIFISAVTGMGLTDLKDMLWREITAESNRIEPSPITHRPLDVHHRVAEEDEFIFTPEPIEEDPDEEFGDDGEWDDLEWEYGDEEE